jgi:alanyl-tRNA synthetase
VKARDLKRKYLDFFVKRGHKKLPNVSLVPEDDSTTLFISAGVQLLVPYFLIGSHPLGKKLVSLQRCLRTGDIEEVSNVFHNTFFEMLGNWSLGAYWKKESLSLSYEFLTQHLNLDSKRFHVTIFKGDQNAPKDGESEKIWLSLGIPKERIYPLDKENNWWEVGKTGPGGPDSEIFYDIGKSACSPNCRPGDGCGRFFEMWNNVFMEYHRKPDGTYEKLKQKNVDTGMGVERTAVVLEGKDDVFKTTSLAPIIKKFEEVSKKKYEGENKKPMRIIADHLRAASFVIADGITPSNVEQGYVLRRLIRRAMVNGRKLGAEKAFTTGIAKEVIDSYQKEYPHLKKKEKEIFQGLKEEEARFGRTLERGLREIKKHKILDGKVAFRLYETYGIPLEVIEEIARERGQRIEKRVFEKKFKKHQELSRIASKGMFAGGLADHSETVTKLHTATHLLHQALREVLGDHIKQFGSNITSERLRFDFAHPEKLTEAQIKKAEKIINERIKANLPVKMEMMSLGKAKKKGALAFFAERYGDQVKVYSIGDYSREICGGPHVDSTGVIGGVKIIRQKAVGANRRRVYAKLVV